jgi:hypothetical protein
MPNSGPSQEARPTAPLSALSRRTLLNAGLVAATLAVLTYTQLTPIAPYVLFGCALTPLFWLLYERQTRPLLRGDALTGGLLALLLWAGITLLWSPGGSDGVASWARLAAFIALVLIARSELNTLPDDVQRAQIFAFVLAFGCATLIALFDHVGALPVRRFLMSVLPQATIDPQVVLQGKWVVSAPAYITNKSQAVLMSLFWPALLATFALARSRTRAKTKSGQWSAQLAVAALVVTFAAATLRSENETAKLALGVSALAFLAARVSRQLALRLTIAGWFAATLLMFPMAVAVDRTKLADNQQLQYSAQHRLAIWSFVSREIATHPVHGAGLAATRGNGDPDRGVMDVGRPGTSFIAGTKIQPHNGFLQVWNELGGIGALLLFLAGLALIVELARASPMTRPFYFAAFAAATVLVALQWSINSSWFMAVFGVSALFMRLAADFSDRTEAS